MDLPNPSQPRIVLPEPSIVNPWILSPDFEHDNCFPGMLFKASLNHRKTMETLLRIVWLVQSQKYINHGWSVENMFFTLVFWWVWCPPLGSQEQNFNAGDRDLWLVMDRQSRTEWMHVFHCSQFSASCWREKTFLGFPSRINGVCWGTTLMKHSHLELVKLPTPWPSKECIIDSIYSLKPMGFW